MRRKAIRSVEPAVPAQLKRKFRLVLNEPAIKRPGDMVPALKRVRVAGLGLIIGTRLRLESDLRVCGLAKPGRSRPLTSAGRKVLLAMLREKDSPLSASLRMRATAHLGPAGVKAAAPLLRRIALDESDDLATRLGAVSSYFQLAQDQGVATFLTLVRSPLPLIRAASMAEAVNSRSRRLRDTGQSALAAERNDQVKAYVRYRVKMLRGEKTTGVDEA